MSEAKVPDGKELGPIQPGEEILGIIDDDIKPLWVVAEALRAEALATFEAHQESHRAEEPMESGSCKTAIQTAERLIGQCKLVQDIFWTSVREQFPTALANVGVREDWRAVTWEDPAEGPRMDRGTPLELGGLFDLLGDDLLKSFAGRQRGGLGEMLFGGPRGFGREGIPDDIDDIFALLDGLTIPTPNGVLTVDVVGPRPRRR